MPGCTSLKMKGDLGDCLGTLTVRQVAMRLVELALALEHHFLVGAR